MEPGGRALGIAESYQTEQSTLCAVCTTPEGRPDGFAFDRCTVGGLDATDSILSLWDSMQREDIHYVFVSGVAPAWFNLLDLERLSTAIPLPVIVLSYEESDGLEASIKSHFSGRHARERLERYRRLPDREPITLADQTLYVRTLHEFNGSIASILRAYTIDGKRPEPVRIARLCARAADHWRPGNAQSG